MEKALTPMTAKKALRKAIREALGLKGSVKIDTTEEADGKTSTKRFAMEANATKDNGYRDIVGFTTYYFPGCCKYGIVSQVYINGRLRGKKLTRHVLNWAVAQVSYDGYSKAVGTTARSSSVKESDSQMESLLKKTGWKCIDRGINSNTENIVSMWIKPTGKTEKRDTFMSCGSA